MSGAHTAGPWEAFKGVEEGDELRCGVSAMRGDLGYLIATIENGAPGDFCDTEFANARLIAAAPDYHSAAAKLLAAFDLLQSATAAERIMVGLSDRDLRKASNDAIAELRAAHAKTTQP